MPYVQKDEKWYFVDEVPVMTPPVPDNQQLPPVAAASAIDPKITRLEADLAEQRRITQQLQSQMPQPQRQPNAAPDMRELNRQFYQDPVLSSQAIARQAAHEALAQHGQAGQETLIQVAQEQARKKDPDLWDKYHTEIEQIVNNTVDPQFRTNVNVWQFAFNKIIGDHVNDIRDAVRQQSPQAPAIRISKEGGPALPNGAQPAAGAGPESKLSKDELEMAKNLEIEPALYAQGKELYDSQNHKGPSSWDKYVTFDSRISKREARNAKRAAAAKK